MSMPPLEDPHGHHHLPPGTTEDDIAAAAAAAVPSALNRKCGNPTCNDWALRGRGELRFVSVFSCSALVCVAFGDTTPMVGYGTMFIFVFFSVVLCILWLEEHASKSLFIRFSKILNASDADVFLFRYVQAASAASIGRRSRLRLPPSSRSRTIPTQPRPRALA